MSQPQACIFCKIASKKIPSEFLYEDEQVFIIADKFPKTNFHFLVIPKKHISTINDLSLDDKNLIANIQISAVEFAKQKGFADYGYSTRYHCNAGGGQEIFHIHLHIMSNKPN